MPDWLNRENTFMVISLAIAGLFGWGFFTVAGIPPTKVSDNWQLLFVFMIFLIIPFAQKLHFQFFSFEARIAEVRKEVGETNDKVIDVREDVRHMIAQQNALSASVQSMKHQAVTVNNYERPPQEQVEAAAAEVANVDPLESDASPHLRELTPEDKLLKAIFGDVEGKTAGDFVKDLRLADLFVDMEDINELRKINMSEQVAILRIRVERELKRLLKPHAKEIAVGTRFRGLKLPASQLVSAVMNYHQELTGQRDSFDVFFRIANAASHADEIPYKDLETAVYLGERLLSLLSKVEPSESNSPELPFD
ncbi:hypothetical protein HB773_25565 (plasmid) [Sinorhizobium meliloti]|nr:hypothetical protein HB773_25565 [Sinorhizobium meliloti]